MSEQIKKLRITQMDTDAWYKYWNDETETRSRCFICETTREQCSNLEDGPLCCKCFFDLDDDFPELKGVRCWRCVEIMKKEEFWKHQKPLDHYLVVE